MRTCDLALKGWGISEMLLVVSEKGRIVCKSAFREYLSRLRALFDPLLSHHKPLCHYVLCGCYLKVACKKMVQMALRYIKRCTDLLN